MVIFGRGEEDKFMFRKSVYFKENKVLFFYDRSGLK